MLKILPFPVIGIFENPVNIDSPLLIEDWPLAIAFLRLSRVGEFVLLAGYQVFEIGKRYRPLFPAVTTGIWPAVYFLDFVSLASALQVSRMADLNLA